MDCSWYICGYRYCNHVLVDAIQNIIRKLTGGHVPGKIANANNVITCL